ncbi:hypothetical protein [Ralstonia pseudosolanacearum]|uniref:hypothetical protein n=1 Tax=Ralstonia pseudosolanacearum TaxID=1310165 RepID=UPI003CE957F6
MKKRIAAIAFFLLFGAGSSARAVEMVLSSTDPRVDPAKFSEVVNKYLPDNIKALGAGFKMVGVLETASYRDGDSFYFYSLTLHRSVIEQGTGTQYWVPSGGIRSYGITAGGEALEKQLRDDVVMGAKSFKTGQ